MPNRVLRRCDWSGIRIRENEQGSGEKSARDATVNCGMDSTLSHRKDLREHKLESW